MQGRREDAGLTLTEPPHVRSPLLRDKQGGLHTGAAFIGAGAAPHATRTVGSGDHEKGLQESLPEGLWTVYWSCETALKIGCNPYECWS